MASGNFEINEELLYTPNIHFGKFISEKLVVKHFSDRGLFVTRANTEEFRAIEGDYTSNKSRFDEASYNMPLKLKNFITKTKQYDILLSLSNFLKGGFPDFLVSDKNGRWFLCEVKGNEALQINQMLFYFFAKKVLNLCDIKIIRASDRNDKKENMFTYNISKNREKIIKYYVNRYFNELKSYNMTFVDDTSKKVFFDILRVLQQTVEMPVYVSYAYRVVSCIAKDKFDKNTLLRYIDNKFDKRCELSVSSLNYLRSRKEKAFIFNIDLISNTDGRELIEDSINAIKNKVYKLKNKSLDVLTKHEIKKGKPTWALLQIAIIYENKPEKEELMLKDYEEKNFKLIRKRDKFARKFKNEIEFLTHDKWSSDIHIKTTDKHGKLAAVHTYFPDNRIYVFDIKNKTLLWSEKNYRQNINIDFEFSDDNSELKVYLKGRLIYAYNSKNGEIIKN